MLCTVSKPSTGFATLSAPGAGYFKTSVFHKDSSLRTCLYRQPGPGQVTNGSGQPAAGQDLGTGNEKDSIYISFSAQFQGHGIREVGLGFLSEKCVFKPGREAQTTHPELSRETASPGDPDGHISGDGGASGVWLLPRLCVSDWRGKYVQLWTAVTTAVARHVNSLCPVGSERRVGLGTQGFCVLFHSCNRV